MLGGFLGSFSAHMWYIFNVSGGCNTNYTSFSLFFLYMYTFLHVKDFARHKGIGVSQDTDKSSDKSRPKNVY